MHCVYITKKNGRDSGNQYEFNLFIHARYLIHDGKEKNENENNFRWKWQQQNIKMKNGICSNDNHEHIEI